MKLFKQRPRVGRWIARHFFHNFCLVAFILLIVLVVGILFLCRIPSSPTLQVADYGSGLLAKNNSGQQARAAAGMNGPEVVLSANQQQLTNTADNLFWFIQISDIHISIFVPERTANFERFLNTTLRIINPEFVIASGDVVHAQKDEDLQLVPNEQEWIIYRDLLTKYGFYDPSFWIDVAGNHDTYGRPGLDSPRNWPAQYLVTSQRPDFDRHKRVYNFTHVEPFGTYSIVYFDPTPSQGMGIILNYLQSVGDDLLDDLESALRASTEVHNQTIMMNHFPTNILHDSDALKTNNRFIDLSSKYPFNVMLTGHLHLDHCKNRFGSGLIDLELNDFKEDLFYRILAFDSDMLSFADLPMDTWPAIVITNPKDATWLAQTEPLARMRTSTHVRVLVFSDVEVTQVQLFIDDKLITDNMQRGGAPAATSNTTTTTATATTAATTITTTSQHIANRVLPAQDPASALFVAPWEPSRYFGSAKHSIRVVATDAANRTRSVEQDFNLDGETSGTNFGSSLFLGTNLKSLFAGVGLTFLAFDIVYFLVVPKLCRLVLRKLGLEPEVERIVHEFRMRHFVRYDRLEGVPPPPPPPPLAPKEQHKMTVLEHFVHGCTEFMIAILAEVWRFARIPLLVWSILAVIALWYLFGVLWTAPLNTDAPGDLTERWGVVMLWGVAINGEWQPYFGSIWHIALPSIVGVYTPLIQYVALPYGNSAYRILHHGAKETGGRRGRHRSLLKAFLWDCILVFRFKGYIYIAIIVASTVIMWYIIWSLDGFGCLLLSPMVFWLPILALGLILYTNFYVAPRVRRKLDLTTGMADARKQRAERARELQAVVVASAQPIQNQTITTTPAAPAPAPAEPAEPAASAPATSASA